MAGTRGQGAAQITLKASSPTTTDRHTRNPTIPELRPKIDRPWQSSPRSHASTETRAQTTKHEIAGRPGSCEKPKLPRTSRSNNGTTTLDEETGYRRQQTACSTRHKNQQGESRGVTALGNTPTTIHPSHQSTSRSPTREAGHSSL